MIYTDEASAISLELPDILVSREDPWHYIVQAVSRAGREAIGDGEAVILETAQLMEEFDAWSDAGLVVR